MGNITVVDGAKMSDLKITHENETYSLTSFIRKNIKMPATDRILINADQSANLIRNVFTDSDETDDGINIGYIPADILISKTLPILNMEIVADEFKNDNGSLLVRKSVQVNILENYGYTNNGFKVYGTISLNSSLLVNNKYDDVIISSIISSDKDDNLCIFSLAMAIPSQNYVVEDLTEGYHLGLIGPEEFDEMFVQLMRWYAIEVSLLNPLVKNVLSKHNTEVNNHTYTKYSTKKKPKKYIKVHYVNKIDIDDEINKVKKERGFNRHTLIWYQIGHWRTYKSGKKVFIKPCWKGPLRLIKDTNTQDRVIAQAE